MLRKFLKFDFVLLGALLLLVAISLVVIYSMSFSGDSQSDSRIIFFHQLAYVALGFLLFFIFSKINYNFWLTYCNWIYFFGIILLLIVLFWGSEVRGTLGWLSIKGLNFQPVEAEKVFLLVFLAGFFSRKKGRLSELVRIVTSIFLLILPLVLVMSQPDLGSALMLILLWLGMILVSGISWKNFLVLLLVGLMVAFSAWFLLEDYQKQRIETFINPELDPKGGGYNVIQSIVAVGSGGIFGKGLGHGSQSQLNFLPEKHTDFIFAAASEELGLVGASVILALYFIILYRVYKISSLAKDNFSYLVGLGALVLFISHFLINVGMNMGITPVTGVPLPFLSYGGSSMISFMALLGMVNNIYLNRKRVDALE